MDVFKPEVIVCIRGLGVKIYPEGAIRFEVAMVSWKGRWVVLMNLFYVDGSKGSK